MPGLSASDANLEVTFANLAFARLKDKAQTLLDYLIGFQMIDKNEEETHAIGVFGFKVGKEWVYAPVFFINGELKGHELMYIKSQDAFVPMTEQWVNYILNRRPKVLGEAEDTPRSQIGIRQPDFDIFARAPYIGSKSASLNTHSHHYIHDRVKDYAKPAMDLFCVSPRHEKYAGLNSRFTVDGALRVFGKRAMLSLFKTMQKDAKFADAITNFYSVKELVKAAEEDSIGVTGSKPKDERDSVTKDQRKDEKDTTPTPKVVTLGNDPDTFIEDLSDADRAKLLRDRYLVIDKREEGSKTRMYRTQLSMTISSPVKTGLYDVVTPSGEKKKMFVAMNPIRTGYSRDPLTVVIDPESKKFGTFANSDILTTTWHGKDKVSEWVKKLPAGDSLDIGDTAILVDEDGKCTDVFNVERKTDIPGGGTEMKIYSRTYAPSGRGLSPIGSASRLSAYSYDSQERVDSIVFTSKENVSIQILGRSLFIPKNFKALVLKSLSAEEKKNRRKYDSPCCPGETDLAIASVNEAINEVKKEASLGRGPYREMKLAYDGVEYRAEVNGRQDNNLSKAAAVKLLVERHRLGEDDALFLMKEARENRRTSMLLKYAYTEGSQPVSGTFIEPDIHDEADLGTQVQYPHTTSENVGQTDNSAAHEAYDNTRYVDDEAKSQAQSASTLGQKEVLDTAVISGLVKTMDAHGTVDGYIGDLLLGLDRIGRILFMYYWHNDKFKERYGQQDMIELEDNLRNVFKNLGDLTLFLKQKTIEPDEGESSEVKLDSVLAD